MKRRFVITIGVVLAFALMAVGVLHYFLFRTEQDRLIDSRIEATASLLLSSDLSNVELEEFEQAETIIRELIGGERFNQFVIVYRASGQVLYRSPSTVGLPEEISRSEKWQTIRMQDHLIRVLTVPIGHALADEPKRRKDTRILQTGLILDDDLLRLSSVSRHLVTYSVLILLIVVLTSIWLSETLLRPLNSLAHYLRYLSASMDPNPALKMEPEVVPRFETKDSGEFSLLVREAEKLRDVVSQGLRNTQTWTAQMAHELKTPHTILQNSIDLARIEKDEKKRETQLKDAVSEIAHLNSLISSFLEWSSEENFPGTTEDLHATRVSQVAADVCDKFSQRYPGRLRIFGQSNTIVFAKNGFLRQALANLVGNALLYSFPASEVKIELGEDWIKVINHGPGVPSHVLKNIGAPFNRGSSGPGFGLGLAWVQTICRKYGWDLRFDQQSDEQGSDTTIATIEFSQ